MRLWRHVILAALFMACGLTGLARPAQAANIPKQCLNGTLPDNTLVVAIGIDRGTSRAIAKNIPSLMNRLNILPQSSNPKYRPDPNMPVRSADVLVTLPNTPVYLVLSAVEPVIWNINKDRHASIAGVILTGEEPQGIRGLPRGTRVIMSTTKDNPLLRQYNCRNVTGTYSVTRADHILVRANRLAEALLKRPIDAFFDVSDATPIFLLGPRTATANALEQALAKRASKNWRKAKSTATRPQAISAKDIPNGIPGLIALEREGYIRRASQSDVMRYMAAGRQTNITPSQPLEKIDQGKTFVVLRPTHLPQGPFGKDTITFLVPPASSLPNHSPDGAQLVRYGTRF